MKKSLFAFSITALALLALASCDKTSGNSKSDALNDSTAVAYGSMAGNIILSDYHQFASSQEDAPSKDQILKGVKLVFSHNPDKGTLIGIQMATQMLSEIDHIESQGLKINRAKVLKAFTNAFMADSIDYSAVATSSQQFQDILSRAIEAAKESPEEVLNTEDETSPAAQNGQAAEVFMDMLKTENPNILTSPSGLSYEILNPGAQEHPNENSTVEVEYTGRLIDGTVFDSSEGHGPVTFPISGVIAGFGEGLQLIGKGGKAILYIPGYLAYGEQGVPQAGIGPNEMLIFDIELINFK